VNNLCLSYKVIQKNLNKTKQLSVSGPFLDDFFKMADGGKVKKRKSCHLEQ